MVLDRLDPALDLFPQSPLRHPFNDRLLQTLSAFPALFHYAFAELLPADIYKRRQVCQCKGLTAVLVAGNLRNDLSCHITRCKEAVRLLDQRLADHSPVLQHILQIDQVTVMFLLSKIIRIVEMDDSLFMRIHDLRREQHALRQVLADLARHIIPLGRIDHRVLVGILLSDLFVDILDQGEYTVVRCVGLTLQFSPVAVTHILLRNLISPHLHDTALNHILDIFYIHRVSKLSHTGRNIICNRNDLVFVHLMDPVYLFIRRLNSVHDLRKVKDHFLPIPLDHIRLHFHIH